MVPKECLWQILKYKIIEINYKENTKLIPVTILTIFRGQIFNSYNDDT